MLAKPVLTGTVGEGALLSDQSGTPDLAVPPGGGSRLGKKLPGSLSDYSQESNAGCMNRDSVSEGRRQKASPVCIMPRLCTFSNRS